MSDPVHDAGMTTRREVLGDEFVDAAQARVTDFSAPFDAFLTRTAWGEVWTRDDKLDRRSRSMVTLTALMTLGQTDELAAHVRAALRNGLTREEIAEVLMHASVYAGIPKGRSAFIAAQRVLDDEDA
jgi:4-carboxymuconolactone decarboxylase